MSHLPPLEMVLDAYSRGLFPMAESADAETFAWYEAPLRGVLSIDNLHVSRRLRRTVLGGAFEIGVDTDFLGVINGCAAPAEKRANTWINRGIRDLFVRLHEEGHAHSLECWQNGKLVGGVYGLAIGGVFCGESMFSQARDASKVALVHLCARLQRGGFELFDAQLVNPHLRQFGIQEVPRDQYMAMLRAALPIHADFRLNGYPGDEMALVREYLEFLDK
ncbi:MAG TPA: leucyl/phenylalanyl-tRNA--protein transferase [Patescibacteria group bacterium]|nr:leucyl/phenylalanyl-tRNA--protein transferase [Patescibacteria group bacterium]